jgi:chromosome segregation ATPase
MAKDPNTDVSISEFLDTLEKGKRTYECFKYALEVGQRLANHEQVERELIAKAESARKATEQVEQRYRDACDQWSREVTVVKEKSLADMAAVRKDEEAAILKIRNSTQTQQDKLQRELADLSVKVEAKKIEVSQLQQQSVDLVNELRKIEKQVANAREAKRALLEA